MIWYNYDLFDKETKKGSREITQAQHDVIKYECN